MDAKNREIKKTKRAWYSSPAAAAGTDSKKRILLRWYNDEDDQVYNKGPFHSEEKAVNALNENLRQGVCTWLVSYSDK
tara:strand:+ start:1750 stop:1983 length:234 start_codon:yes stop_codon:yes gene_type:complete